MYRNKVSILFLLFVILLPFQNCDLVGDFEVSTPFSTASLGGGEAYDGKLEPGTYVHEVINFGCKDLSPFQRSKVKVDQKFNIEMETRSGLDCQVAVSEPDLKDFVFDPQFKDYFVYKGRIYKRAESLNSGWVTEVWCRGEKASAELSIMAEFAPDNNGSRLFVGKNNSIPSKRNLDGKSLTYNFSDGTIEIDLSAEVFLGAKRYSGKFVGDGKTENLLCYAGSGILPTTTSKLLDSNSFDSDPFSPIIKIGEGVSPDNRIYYSVKVSEDGSEVIASSLDLLTGKKGMTRFELSPGSQLKERFWAHRSHNDLVLVFNNPDESQNNDSNLVNKAEVLTVVHLGVLGDGLILKKIISSNVLVSRSGIRLLDHNEQGLAWLNFGNSGAVAHLSYSVASQSLIREVRGFGHLSEFDTVLEVAAPLVVSPDLKSSVFQVWKGGAYSSELYSKFVLATTNLNELKPLSGWGNARQRARAFWLGHDEVWFGDTDLEGSLVTKRLKGLASESEELHSLVNYELYKVNRQKDYVEVSYRPDHAYLDALPGLVKLFNINTGKITNSYKLPYDGHQRYFSHLFFPNTQTLLFEYFYHGDLLNHSLYFSDSGSGVLKDVPIGSISQGSVEGIETSHEQFLLVKSSRFGETSLSGPTLFDFKVANGSFIFDSQLSGVEFIERVRETSRIIYGRDHGGNIILFVRDLETGKEVSLDGLIQVPAGYKVVKAFPIAGRSSLVLRLESRSGDVLLAKHYIVKIEGL